MNDAGERSKYLIHERCHSYGLNVIRDPALAHRYVVWVQPTYEESSRYETEMMWDESAAFIEAALLLSEWRVRH